MVVSPNMVLHRKLFLIRLFVIMELSCSWSWTASTGLKGGSFLSDWIAYKFLKQDNAFSSLLLYAQPEGLGKQWTVVKSGNRFLADYHALAGKKDIQVVNAF